MDEVREIMPCTRSCKEKVRKMGNDWNKAGNAAGVEVVVSDAKTE